MLRLPRAVRAWNTSDFEEVLAKEVAELGLEHLPLQQGLSFSSVALDHNLKIVVLDVKDRETSASIKLGAFYNGIVAGCSCADDPTPTDEVNEYCELIVEIDLNKGDASVSLST